MEIGLVKKIDIDQEMQQSYLDYAMSVIVSRALPDARDGLKPVQRRILFAMYDMGLRANSGHRKSARIVGEVLGKYHPHGDVAVYEAMARMAQDFSMRYPLVDGQGNFGSIDGDPPAAMRYTEASILPLAMELLTQIDRETVNFINNFDGTLSEPEVLPAAVPNLLLNGASGIAVGMATNVPPHNLVELVDAMIFMLDNWNKLDDVNVSDLMEFVKGPDFPTGGMILLEGESNNLLTAYATGRGRIKVRGVVQLEEMSRGRNRILITELPYTVNKASLIGRIADLARENKIEGISDLRDESDRQGMRIVIELSKTVDPEDVLKELYKKTPLETTFGITILALVDNEPRLLSLKQALRVYLEHRIDVIRRRSQYDLKKAKEREHVLAGLRVAVNNIDEIIGIIRRAADVTVAKTRLMRKYRLSEIQAVAILDMQLRRLAALERKKIEEEYKQILATIKKLEQLLKSARRIRAVVAEELLEMRDTYGDRRRTQIVSLEEGGLSKGLLTISDLVPAMDTWIGVTPDGLISRSLSNKLPRVSGRQAAQWVIKSNTHHTAFFLVEDGRAVASSVTALPEANQFHEGAPLAKFSSFRADELIADVFTVPNNDADIPERYVITISRFGLVKKSSIEELPGPSASDFVLARVNEDDAIIKAIFTNGQSDICLVTAMGMMIRFSENEVRPMGLIAAGVNGIKLGKDDYIIGAVPITEQAELLLLSTNGLGWRFSTDSIPVQGRYGQGVIACKLKKGEELIGCMLGKNTQQGIVHFHKYASKLVRIDAIPLSRRNITGKLIFSMREEDMLYYLTTIYDGLSFWKEKTSRR